MAQGQSEEKINIDAYTASSYVKQKYLPISLVERTKLVQNIDHCRPHSHNVPKTNVSSQYTTTARRWVNIWSGYIVRAADGYIETDKETRTAFGGKRRFIVCLNIG